MIRLFKEPLVHFMLAGALLFAAYATFEGDVGDGNKAPSVRITESDVTWLKATWTRQWGRDPSPPELRQLVTAFLKEELFAREARLLGLDENDTVVRRRLAQKLEFLIQDASQSAEPSEDELRRFHDEHRGLFRTEPRVSFSHIYFGTTGRGDPEKDAAATLGHLLRSDIEAHSQGDRFLHGFEFDDLDPRSIAALFGNAFAEAVVGLVAGDWQGPIASGFGIHLVLIREHIAGTQRTFEEVRAPVLARWRESRSRHDYEQYFTNLLTKYDVELDQDVRSIIGAAGARFTVADTMDGTRDVR